MSRPVRILLVDDSEVYVNLMKTAIGGVPEVELAGVAGTGAEGVRLAHDLSPDVISMDVHMRRLVLIAVHIFLRRPGGTTMYRREAYYAP